MSIQLLDFVKKLVAGSFISWSRPDACMVGQLIWVLTIMPETKGIPLEEIEERMGIGR